MRKNLAIILLLFPVLSFSQELATFLILNDIGAYKYRPKRTGEMYGSSGTLIPTGHFDSDHNDTTYKTRYVHPVTILGVDVQVTQHAGSDSDKWLLHEVERVFRNYYGMPGDSYVIRQINGNSIMAAGTGGWRYVWLSGNKVVNIQYTDLQMSKSEPLEVVQAYLTKHPSTLPVMSSSDLRTPENKAKWIKDEMERRLWLCDKWSMQYQLGKVTQSDMIRELVEHMTVFLDYRDRYYGIKADDEKMALSNYLLQNNGTAIRNRLSEYKTWWGANKGRVISLP
ncbi:MAG: hypothetical protein AB1805_01325 [Nitrospirota bacterium]